MKVTEDNLPDVNKILRAVGDSFLRLYAISSANYVDMKERLGTAQLAVDIFQDYYIELQKLDSKQ